MYIVYILCVVLAGMGLSIEAGLLGPLGEQVGHLWASFSIFSIGTLILLLSRLFICRGRTAREPWRNVPKWQFIGGFLGPIYVVVLTLATPTLGVTMTMIGVLFGQVMKSLVIDVNGWFGMLKQPINRLRILGMFWVVLALVFTYIGAK